LLTESLRALNGVSGSRRSSMRVESDEPDHRGRAAAAHGHAGAAATGEEARRTEYVGTVWFDGKPEISGLTLRRSPTIPRVTP
jgi:hypothetical protein